MKIAMIGCGKLGLPCAEVMSQQYDVVGYDVVKDPAAQIPLLDSIEETVKDRDFIFVAVPTPHDPVYGGSKPIADLPTKDFDYSIVQEVLTEINKYVTQEQLVVLISTVLPGTVRTHLRPCITNARFIYNPYLIAMGSVKWDMVNPECLIIGTEDGSETGDAKLLSNFYIPIMENTPRINVGTWDEAEAIKVFYNTFISAKLGLVNMIQDVAEKNGNINVDVVTDALKAATQRITGPRYLTAGLGDAGACVLPSFPIEVNGVKTTIENFYDSFNADQTFLVKSASYSMSKTDQKKVYEATSREYDDDILVFTTKSGKVLECTPEHLIPIQRDGSRMIVRADEITVDDMLHSVL